MSNSHSTSPTGEPSDRRIFFSAIGWVGVILIFVLIVWLAYIPYRPAPIDQAIIDRRIEIRKKVTAEQHQAVTTYGWVDQGKGVVRIPIEQAMEITVNRTQKLAKLDNTNSKTTAAVPTATN